MFLRLFTLLASFLCYYSAFSQLPPDCDAPTSVVPPAEDCPTACIYCDFANYMGSTAGYAGNGFPPGGFCSMIQNDQWLGFIAGAASASFNIISSHCNNGDGVQVALYESCNTPPLVCNPGCTGCGETPTTINATMIIGTNYFLLIDGLSGDECDLTINVVPADAVHAPPVGAIGNITGPATVCPGATVIYEVASVTGAGAYTWSSTTPGVLFNGLYSPVQVDAPEGRTVQITFPTGVTGNVQICVKADNSCKSGPQTCRTINVQPIPPTVFPPVTVRSTDLPYELPWGDLASTPATYQTTLTSWLGCDSIVRQKVIILYPKAEVFAFWDINGNNIHDAGEVAGSGITIATQTGKSYTTDNLGDVIIFDLAPNDTVRVSLPSPHVVSKPAFYVYSGPFKTFQFALSAPAGALRDVSVDLTNTNAFRQGFTTNLVITVRNEGVLDITGNTQLKLVLPYPLEYQSASPGLTATNGDTLVWSLGAMPAGAVKTITLKVRTRLGTANNTPLHISAWSPPFTGEINASNNYAVLETATVGSFDPNDKQVRPAHVTPAMLAGGQPFEYTVRFQNTGDFPADFVRITDVLADEIDPASLRLIASSHACTWKFLSPNTVEFFFGNIQLPDSLSNEPESHGFVKFSVLPRKNLPLGTAIRNFCDIFFDFNDPVRTNTTGTQVVAFLPGQLPPDDALKVRPNPAAWRALCSWTTPAPVAGRLRLFNLDGLPVVEVSVGMGSTTGELDVAALPSGVYVAWLEAGNLSLAKKVVVLSGILKFD